MGNCSFSLVYREYSRLSPGVPKGVVLGSTSMGLLPIRAEVHPCNHSATRRWFQSPLRPEFRSLSKFPESTWLSNVGHWNPSLNGINPSMNEPRVQRIVLRYWFNFTTGPSMTTAFMDTFFGSVNILFYRAAIRKEQTPGPPFLPTHPDSPWII